MSEVLRTAIQLAPFVAGGDAIGAVTDYVMARKVAEERQPVSEVMDGINDDLEVIAPSRLSTLKQVGRRAVSTVALTTALAVGVNAYAWSDIGQPGEHQPAVEFVADLSGATAYGHAPTAEAEVNKVAKDLAGEDSVNTTALVAKGGQTIPTKPEDVPSVAAFGDAPMPDAFATAIANLRLERQQNPDSTSSGDHSGAIVVATNGNEFGPTNDVVEKAKSVNASVVIVNTSEGATGTATAQFKLIAKQTGGEYFNRKDLKSKDVAQEVAKDIVPPKDKKKQKDDKLPAKILGLLSLAVLGRLLKDRRNMPLTFRRSKVK